MQKPTTTLQETPQRVLTEDRIERDRKELEEFRAHLKELENSLAALGIHLE